jgi:hypothetical protein
MNSIMAERPTRGRLFRWMGWFLAANTLVLCLASMRYLGSLEGVALTPLTLVYIGTAYLSHLGLLSALTLGLVLTPLILVHPRKALVLAAGVTLMAVVVAAVTLDSLLWTQSRFHLNLFTVRILGTPSWVFSAVMLLIALLFESFLARSVWRWISASPTRKGWLLGSVLGLNLLVAQGIHAWADASYHTPVTSAAVTLPAYRGVTAKSLLERYGLVDVRFSRERELAQRMSRDFSQTRTGGLNYPLQPLVCSPEQHLNLLLIVVDSLRSDTLSPADTPNIHRLAERRATRFLQHFSGGNSSRIGLFSLFYGLPPGYFDSFEALQRPAVLVQESQRQGYQLGIFSSSSLARPAALDRTAFAAVPEVEARVPDIEIPHTERVKIINDSWLQWLDQIDPDKPFFSYLYYDSSRKPVPPGLMPENATAAQREFAEYRAAMRANDALVGVVLDKLQQQELLDQTVVLITSDHGEQFGEHGDGIVGHGAGYSREQLHVPLVLHLPGMAATTVSTRTSHYDVVPTLMGRVLGCSNPASDYSSGADLLDRASWEWLMVGSYYNYAVLEPDQVIITFPNGTFEVRDADYRIRKELQFRPEIMQAIATENKRFYR